MKTDEVEFFGALGLTLREDGSVQAMIIGNGIATFTALSQEEATEAWLALRDATSPNGVWEE